MTTKQFTKYDSSEEQVFTILDQAQPCARCGHDTLTIILPDKICSRCARKKPTPSVLGSEASK